MDNGMAQSPEIFISSSRALLEGRLHHYLAHFKETEVVRVARYVTLSGGHRWRPLVLLASGRIFGENRDQSLLAAACGLELVHSASLVLDDLPSMDDASMRRGQPCPHHVFPRWAVDMAPPFLVNAAYSLLLSEVSIPAERRIQAAIDLGATGVSLCEGQIHDLNPNLQPAPLDDILTCYQLKTGSLYAAAGRIAGILCGGSQNTVNSLSRCGMKLGLAVQCFDDVADVISDVTLSGKHPGSDVAKKTIVDCLGIDEAIDTGKRFQQEALAELESLSSDCNLLRRLIQIIPHAIVPASTRK
jgi:geranylgeranyl diphosphate synthase type II